MSLPPIIGLTGVARAGKDTIGQILHDLYGYHLASYSDILNKALYTLDREGGDDFSISIPMLANFGRMTIYERYSDLVDRVGYEEAKEFAGVRKALQVMGTEVGRNLLGDNIWVEALFKNLPKGLVAITNVRFPNEYDAVKARGGEVWRVSRPGYEPSNGHISDTALDDYLADAWFYNEGTKRELADKVMKVLDRRAPLQRAFHMGSTEA